MRRRRIFSLMSIFFKIRMRLMPLLARAKRQSSKISSMVVSILIPRVYWSLLGKYFIAS